MPAILQPISETISSETAPVAEAFILRRARRIGPAVGIFEAWLSFFFTVVLTLAGAIGVLPLANWMHLNFNQRFCILGWTIGWICLDVPYLFRLFIVMIRHRKPYGLTAAIETPDFAFILRPVLVCWWLTHFAIGAIMAVMLHANDIRYNQNGHNDLFLAFGLGFPCNGYLMLAVCAATRSEKLRRGFWRFRLLVDLALALMGWIVVQFVQ